MIIVLNFTCTIRRGGSERQLFTIYKYGTSHIRNIIVSIYKPANNYLEEYNVKPEDAFFILHPNIFVRFLRFYALSKKLKPDVVYARDALSFIIASIAGMFQSYKVINGSVRHGITGKDWTHRWRTFILHLSRFIIANSHAGLKANGLKRGFVLYNGIDNTFFADNEKLDAKKSVISKTEHPVFISVANLVPYKDYFSILKALDLLKTSGYQFHYFIIGEGPNRSAIEAQINVLGLQQDVTLVGAIHNVSDYLQQADLFIHSSKGEGCSNAILEAMAAGLPVVASDTGGTPEIVEEAYGRLFAYQNVDELYKHLKWFLDNPEKLKEMGVKAKETAVQRFSVSRMISEYEHIIQQVANKK
jgi:L-malate glycosyltransferase